MKTCISCILRVSRHLKGDFNCKICCFNGVLKGYFTIFTAMNKKFPKVLLCAPQHISKMYCWEQWYERITSLTYPNYDIFIADNSKTVDNTDYINSFEGVEAVWTKDKGNGLLAHINDSHKQCAEQTLKGGYDFMFHLETDVFPPLDVIERLLVHKRPIIGGMYDIYFGKKRKAMIQMKEGYERTLKGYNVVKFLEEGEPLFYDGTVREVFHAGLGCMLIHRDILHGVKFRVEKGVNFHTDTWFANDCFLYNKDIYVDTTIMCKHYNQTWLDNLEKLNEHV